MTYSSEDNKKKIIFKTKISNISFLQDAGHLCAYFQKKYNNYQYNAYPYNYSYSGSYDRYFKYIEVLFSVLDRNDSVLFIIPWIGFINSFNMKETIGFLQLLGWDGKKVKFSDLINKKFLIGINSRTTYCGNKSDKDKIIISSVKPWIDNNYYTNYNIPTIADKKLSTDEKERLLGDLRTKFISIEYKWAKAQWIKPSDDEVKGVVGPGPFGKPVYSEKQLNQIRSGKVTPLKITHMSQGYNISKNKY